MSAESKVIRSDGKITIRPMAPAIVRLVTASGTTIALELPPGAMLSIEGPKDGRQELLELYVDEAHADYFGPALVKRSQ